MYFKKVILIFVIFYTIFLFPDTSPVFEEGEKLFISNKPDEAIVLLEAAREQEPGNEKVYEYLGHAYEQLRQYEKSIFIRKEGLKYSTKNKDRLYLGIGIIFAKQEKHNMANEMFTQAIKTNPENHFVYLNRANARLRMKSYNDALSDYILYLKLKSNDYQRENIEKVIALLKKTIQDEKTFIEDEAKRLAEELARQKALEDAAIKAIEDAANDTTDISAGLEDVIEHHDILDIED